MPTHTSHLKPFFAQSKEDDATEVVGVVIPFSYYHFTVKTNYVFAVSMFIGRMMLQLLDNR